MFYLKSLLRDPVESIENYKEKPSNLIVKWKTHSPFYPMSPQDLFLRPEFCRDAHGRHRYRDRESSYQIACAQFHSRCHCW